MTKRRPKTNIGKETYQYVYMYEVCNITFPIVNETKRIKSVNWCLRRLDLIMIHMQNPRTDNVYYAEP